MAKEFNPAFYVSFGPDGSKYLDPGAQKLWFNRKYPKWRIVADTMDVFSYVGKDEKSKTVLIGTVAAIDEKGVRVLAVPCSVSVTQQGGNCAAEFYESGVLTLFDMLGLTVDNISADHWNEFYSLKRGAAPAKSFGTGNDYGEDYGEEDEKPAAKRSSGIIEPVSATSGTGSGEDYGEEFGDEEMLNLFRDLLVQAPQEIPSYTPGSHVDEILLRKLFNRFCLGETGASWEMADGVERGKIKGDGDNR